MSRPDITDELPISLRAYAVPDLSAKAQTKRSYPKSSAVAASDYTLVFDCETTADHAQSLRFGTYQAWQANVLKECGIFYAPDNVHDAELALLRTFADIQNLKLLTRGEFVDDIFYGFAYRLRARIVGFNLPFDISRIAIRHNSARGKMRGGFTFKLSDDKRWPNVQIKHLSSRAAFIQFAAPFKNRTNRSQRQKGNTEPVRRGHFIDCKTLSGALFAKSFSLKTLCDTLGVENGKTQYDDFNAAISKEFIAYAVRDTQATWECYTALIDKYEKLCLDNTPAEKIYSEASIGKACLKSMGVKPWRECQGDFDPQIIGNIMSAYYGGRSEIGIRRQHRQVMLCDFLSMYPTVCTLMQLWPFVIATGIKQWDAMAEAKAILDMVTPEQLQSKDLWQKLTVLVRVKPDADIFPVRANYGDAAQATIGLNYLTGDKAQWFTLADCIASKLLSGKTPEIIEAIGFTPMAKQKGLSSIYINGNPDYAIDPAKDDFYKRLIELRQSVKGQAGPRNR